MTDHPRTEALIAQLENLWACFDELFDSFSTADWQKRHGDDWTLADVPYHLAYYDTEIIAFPLKQGPELADSDRIEVNSMAALHSWNASQFARRSAYSDPHKAVARWQTTRQEILDQLEGMTDADLERPTWMALTQSRGWRTAEFACVACLAHGWIEFMELRHYAEREAPEPAPEVTHTALDAFLRLHQSLLDRNAAGNREFTLVWEITGPGGGAWTTRVAGGETSLSQGRASDADLTLRMSPLVFASWWNGQIDLSDAIAGGQVDASDQGALATFNALFPPPDPDAALPIA
ncbi:MAG: DinB family protein [Caldilineales bacterium]